MEDPKAGSFGGTIVFGLLMIGVACLLFAVYDTGQFWSTGIPRWVIDGLIFLCGVFIIGYRVMLRLTKKI